MYCVYCNHPLKGDEKECPSCGRPCGTFVQIETFRNGKGQKAAASSLSELTFPERPEDILAKIAAMSKEIKALKQENEELKKEQISLRELMAGQTPTSEGRSFTSMLIPAAAAALIPLIALVIVCVAFSKKTANMDSTAAVMSERIGTVQEDIEELKMSEKDVEELKSTVNTLDEELKSTVKTVDEELKPAVKTVDEELKPIVEKLEKDIEDIKAGYSGEETPTDIQPGGV